MMDAKEFLKKYLDSKTGHIKNKDLQEIIPQLQKIISEQTAGREPRRDEIQIITSDNPNAWETNLTDFDEYRNLAG